MKLYKHYKKMKKRSKIFFIDDFKTKEAEFTIGTLSHYGQGIHNSSEDDKSSIRVFKSKEKYRVQFSYNSKLKMKNFL